MVLTIFLTSLYSEDMVLKCAWCGRILDASESSVTSHGICPECKRAFMKNRERRTSPLSGILSPRETSSPGQGDLSYGKGDREMEFII